MMGRIVFCSLYCDIAPCLWRLKKRQGADRIFVEGIDASQRSLKKQARAYRFALLNKISEKYNSSP